MAKRIWYLSRAADLQFGLRQALDEGRILRDVTALHARVEAINRLPDEDPEKEVQALALTDELESAPLSIEGDRKEPSTWEAIQAAIPPSEIDFDAYKGRGKELSDSELSDKIYGAWLGRCSGCLLGQPVEGWKRNRIRGFVQATQNMPISRYFSSDIDQSIRNKYDVIDDAPYYGGRKRNWINNTAYGPSDDDTNYTVLALKLLEDKGRAFTPYEVGENWLFNIPVCHIATAERVAYFNIASGFEPPKSAWRRNPYREYIGAQIRADLYGYVNPGDPRTAADMAFRDASISHVKNGIYGSMFMAAAIAAGAVESEPLRVVEAGLSAIPPESRLAIALRETLEGYANGEDFSQFLARLDSKWNEDRKFEWTHVIPNALITISALLHGKGDFTRTIGLAVEAGFDTDCNAASAGSIIGMMMGASAIPVSWTAPLRDTLKTGVASFGFQRISDLAARTMACSR